MATEGQTNKNQYHMNVKGPEESPGEVHQMVTADDAEEIKEREAKLKNSGKK
ncbi:hypothetical protein [Fictibacillus barbaricus]|uniref:YfhD family protein n=1 Tax=Fictibacillus barbaricus TaxID=182136 RepID=A0ABS2Z9W5_9BACL|nr:hypothetical protein [Fictibacillus barbaricus]MBN3544958.1 hypothetical protein [Fictibacillus barbaricus]GGB62793.1 hypothetical protein GCM10007199_30960 [Fictibacillus barbaricus]